MKKYEFSEDQKKAIFTEGNVIVSAGAGSGKTTVMIERIVNKLASGVKLEDMLIVTFTRAAAADIRVKLAEKLTDIKTGGGKNADMAAEALLSLPVCNIGTLHSFCQRLIRMYFYAAEIDPAATVMDEDDVKAMKRACINAAVRAAKERGDQCFTALNDMLSSRRDDSGAVDAVLGVIDFALSLPDPDGYLSNAVSDGVYYAELDQKIKDERAALVKRIEPLLERIEVLDFTAIRKAAGELIPYMDGLIDGVTRTKHTKKGDERDELNENFKAIKEACADYREKRECVEKALSTDSLPYAEALLSVARDALSRYRARKTALNKTDYSDLEHGAYKVLSDERCVAELAPQIKYVFIDEFQDINPLQADIADKLKTGAGAEMFLVGDIKQSIYAFRRCNPKFFKAALGDGDFTAVYLTDNYRSSEEVINFVNDVFTGIMEDGFGGADYAKEKLVFRSGKRGAAALYSIPEPEKPQAALGAYSVMKAVSDSSAPDPQAVFVLNTVLDYIAGGKDRRYSDIAVLVRSAKTRFCDGLVRLFRQNGIPVNAGKKSTVSDFPEAGTLLKIAKCVDDRFDDVALYVALRSSMGGFSDDELLAIAEAGEAEAFKKHIGPEYGVLTKSYYFWQKVNCYKGELKDRLDRFFALRSEFSEYASRHDAADTLGYITSTIDYFQSVYESGGNAGAVEALIAEAARRKCDLTAFVDAVNGESALSVGDGGDAVTLTTVHASKGLEYDLCIVADTVHRFNMRDASARVITAERGVAVKIPDETEKKVIASAPWLLANAELPDRMREEELRLLYVALTRAKSYLYVCGMGEKSEKQAKDAINEYEFMQNIASRPADVTLRVNTAPVPPAPLSDAITKAVRDRCEFVYPAKDMPIKTCVTALAEMSDEEPAAAVLTDDDNGPKKKNYGKKRESDAETMLKGTAYHRAMELIDFCAPDTEDVKARCENAELVDFDDILRAVNTVSALTEGKTYFKERYFIADMPISDGGESVLVQSVIDLLITDGEGGATIVDYKTTAPEHIESEAYKTQLKLYAAAVERSTPYSVKKKYIYSFVLDKLIEVK